MLAISRPIKAIHRLKEYIAADSSTEVAQRAREKPDLFVEFEEKISKAVQGLIALVVDKWPADQVDIMLSRYGLDASATTRACFRSQYQNIISYSSVLLYRRSR